jgi:hypothetical protein
MRGTAAPDKLEGAATAHAPGEGGRWVERFLPWLEQIGAYKQ